MRFSELKAMGFPEGFLMTAYLYPGQQFAQKIEPRKKNSPIIFETEKFEEWRVARLQQETNERDRERRKARICEKPNH